MEIAFVKSMTSAFSLINFSFNKMKDVRVALENLDLGRPRLIIPSS
jgi:hypothetical protein